MKYFMDCEFLEGKQKEKFPINLFRKETPYTIDLISIGIVSEGEEKQLQKPCDVYNESINTTREYYAISKDFNLKEAWNRFEWREKVRYKCRFKYYWIRENVLKPIYKELLPNDLDLIERYYRFPTSGKELNKLIISEIVEQTFNYKNLKYLINKYGKTNKQIAEDIKEFISPKLIALKSELIGRLFDTEMTNQTIKWNKFIIDHNIHLERVPSVKNIYYQPKFYAYGQDKCFAFINFMKNYCK